MSYVDLVIASADLAAGAPAGPAPTQAPAANGALNAAGYGAVVVGFLAVGLVVGKWKSVNKDARMMFFVGIVITALLGSGTGMLGGLTNALRQTGNSVGTSISDTTTGR